MWIVPPPVACVTAKLGLPQSVFEPPHGPAFWGSPRSFSISHEAGSMSLKCACVTAGKSASPPATTSARANAFIRASCPRPRAFQAGRLAILYRYNRGRMRYSLSIVFAVVSAAMLTAQTPIDPKTEINLKRLFPSATAFTPKAGDPPHFKAMNGQTLLGLAFWTTELQPLERAYDGPIKILVGMDAKGILTGVVVVEHHEPYGNFSVDTPGFAAQFRGTSIRDAFKVGVDVDAVSRAPISGASAASASRNTARLAHRQLLPPPPSQCRAGGLRWFSPYSACLRSVGRR